MKIIKIYILALSDTQKPEVENKPSMGMCKASCLNNNFLTKHTKQFFQRTLFRKFVLFTPTKVDVFAEFHHHL